MITFSKLEKKGNLGNQLFQIASTIGIAIKNNQDYCFPKWSFNPYFENQLPILVADFDFENIEEQHFHYTDYQLQEANYDFEGWFQSEKFFNPTLAKKHFLFESVFLNTVSEKFQKAFAKKTILLSIRRGDFVDHKDYFQLPIEYYMNALINNFPDWKQRNLIILSDDIDYCKFHFSFLENAFFAQQLSGIEQLALGSLCDDFIISNSTFSWWCAWLGEKKHSRIFRPLHCFTQEKNKVDNDKDFFPDRWEIYNHLNVKLDLGNVVIALKKENAIIKEYLDHYFRYANQYQFVFWKNVEVLKENNGLHLLMINDCIIPPLCIYDVSQKQENSVILLKGNYLNISKYLDYNLFKKQFDYGLFAKFLKQKMKNFNSKKTLVLSIISLEKDLKKTLLNNNIDSYKNSNFNVVFSFGGKIKGFFEYKYYFAAKKRKCIVFIKTFIKNIIRPKKNKYAYRFYHLTFPFSRF